MLTDNLSDCFVSIWLGFSDLSTGYLIHCGQNKLIAILQDTFPKGSPWISMLKFRGTFHWNMHQVCIWSVLIQLQVMVWHRAGDIGYWLLQFDSVSVYYNLWNKQTIAVLYKKKKVPYSPRVRGWGRHMSVKAFQIIAVLTLCSAACDVKSFALLFLCDPWTSQGLVTR